MKKIASLLFISITTLIAPSIAGNLENPFFKIVSFGVNSECDLFENSSVRALVYTELENGDKDMGQSAIWDLFCSSTKCYANKIAILRRSPTGEFIESIKITGDEYDLNVGRDSAEVFIKPGFKFSIYKNGTVEIYKPHTGETFKGICKMNVR